MRKVRLKYKGNDSWDRPVYEDEAGTLWKDTNPRAGWHPSLCTALNNNFDGEPDTPMYAMENYKDAEVIFEPSRVAWN